MGGLSKLTNTLAHMLGSLHERAPNVQAKASVSLQILGTVGGSHNWCVGCLSTNFDPYSSELSGTGSGDCARGMEVRA